jgi:AraC-like DNA-binding protein
MKIIEQNIFGLKAFTGIPQNILSTGVECFLELRGKPDYKIHRLLPKGTSEILFNLGNIFYGKNGVAADKVSNGITCRRYLISGIKTSYLDSFAVDYFHCLAVRFKINGIKKLFDISPAELTDSDYELDCVISKNSVRNLYEKLSVCETTSERFSLLENWLLKKMFNSKDYNRPEPVVNIILSKPMLTVKLLERETGFSRQYLHTKFKDATGLSIKKYQKIKRMTEVLNFLRCNPKKLTQAAYLHGYFDQSHFIKDFKNITGLAPALYSEAAFPGTLDPYIF